MGFAARHPGGLGAHFLWQVRRKLMRPVATNTDELLDTDATGWSATMCNLKDLRDLKEVQFLTKLFADVNADRLPQAMDLLAMRIREIRMAKTAGGSWEKANAGRRRTRCHSCRAP